jgi:hypothetical protein
MPTTEMTQTPAERWREKNREHIREHAKEYARLKRQTKSAPTHKVCKECGQLKRIEAFYEAETVDGHRGACKACHKRKVSTHRRAKAPQPERAPEGWRLVFSYQEAGDALSVYMKGLVIKYDRVTGSAQTRSARYAIAGDDSGKSYESEAQALRAVD